MTLWHGLSEKAKIGAALALNLQAIVTQSYVKREHTTLIIDSQMSLIIALDRNESAGFPDTWHIGQTNHKV